MEEHTFKKCSRCEHLLYKEYFYKSKQTKDGLAVYCRRCESARKKEARKDPKLAQNMRDANKKWYEANKDKKQLQNKTWLKNNKAKTRDTNLKNRFGIDLGDYNTLLESQDRKCAICGVEYDSLDYEMHVDHCHSSGKIRGLLCKPCNLGLGLFKDNSETLLKAIEYLNINKV